jgi:hypothetical protein
MTAEQMKHLPMFAAPPSSLPPKKPPMPTAKHCLKRGAALSGQSPQPAGARLWARGIDGESVAPSHNLFV